VYLVADQLASEQDVARAVAHEVLGHHGLRGHFGLEMDRVLNTVANFRRKDIAPYLQRYGLDAGKESDRQLAAEEWLADMAASNPQLGLVQRAIAAVRSWLRRTVPGLGNMALSDAQIIRDYIEPARRYVQGHSAPKPQAGQGDSGTTQTRQAIPDRVARALSKAQSAPMRQATNFTQAREAAREFQGKPLTNEATGMVAVVSRKSLDKMLSASAVSKSETPAIHSTAVANVDSLFERAVHGWSKPDRAENPDIKAIHRFFAPMEINGRTKMAKLTVKEMVRQERSTPIYTIEAVDFEDGGRQWLEDAAREDGIDLNKEIPRRGEREGEMVDNDPRASRSGFLSEDSAAGDILILAQEVERRNRQAEQAPVFSRAREILDNWTAGWTESTRYPRSGRLRSRRQRASSTPSARSSPCSRSCAVSQPASRTRPPSASSTSSAP